MTMTKRIIAFSFALIFALSSILVPLYAVAKEETYTPTEEEQKKIDSYESKIEDLKEEIEESKQKVSELETKIAETEKTAAPIQEEINELQSQIDSYNSMISALNEQIAALNAEIEAAEQKIEELKVTIAEKQELLGERLRAMYMAGNMSTIEIIFEADSFVDMLNRIELIAQITRKDNAIVQELRASIAEMEATIEELEENKVTLQNSADELVSAKKEVAAQKATVDAKMKELEKRINSLEADSEELEDYVKTLNAQCDAYEAKIESIAKGGSSGDGTPTGDYIWPLQYSKTTLTSWFGGRVLQGKAGNHGGIDIGVKGGTMGKNVSATADGTVLAVYGGCSHNYGKSRNKSGTLGCSCNGGYGNYVMIDHGNGIVSLYAHLTDFCVSKGDYVTQGTVIGRAGSTGRSTGAHLHFEIRVNGTKKDPLNYVTMPSDCIISV